MGARCSCAVGGSSAASGCCCVGCCCCCCSSLQSLVAPRLSLAPCQAVLGERFPPPPSLSTSRPGLPIRLRLLADGPSRSDSALLGATAAWLLHGRAPPLPAGCAGLLAASRGSSAGVSPCDCVDTASGRMRSSVACSSRLAPAISWAIRSRRLCRACAGGSAEPAAGELGGAVPAEALAATATWGGAAAGACALGGAASGVMGAAGGLSAAAVPATPALEVRRGSGERSSDAVRSPC